MTHSFRDTRTIARNWSLPSKTFVTLPLPENAEDERRQTAHFLAGTLETLETGVGHVVVANRPTLAPIIRIDAAGRPDIQAFSRQHHNSGQSATHFNWWRWHMARGPRGHAVLEIRFKDEPRCDYAVRFDLPGHLLVLEAMHAAGFVFMTPRRLKWRGNVVATGGWPVMMPEQGLAEFIATYRALGLVTASDTEGEPQS